MQREDRQSTHLELPIEVHEAMQEQDKPMWETVTEAVRIYLGVDSDSLVALKRRRDRLRQQIGEYEERIQTLKDEREELVTQRNRIEEKIAERKAEQRDYKTILDDVIDELAENPRLNILALQSELDEAARVQNSGRITDDKIDKVCEDVRARVTKRDVDIEERRLRSDLSTKRNIRPGASTEGGLQSVRKVRKNGE